MSESKAYKIHTSSFVYTSDTAVFVPIGITIYMYIPYTADRGYIMV